MAQQNDPKSASPDSKPVSDSMSGGAAGSGVGEKDAVTDVSAPYGTRSRNRNGNSRPNYAEDKDIEMEMYDFYPSDKKEAEGSKRSSSSRHPLPSSNGEMARSNGATRKSTVDDAKTGTASNGHRDQISGSSSSSSSSSSSTPHSSNTLTNAANTNATANASQAAHASGTSQSSRKRKMAGGHNGGSAAPSRRNGVAAGAGSSPAAAAAAATGVGMGIGAGPGLGGGVGVQTPPKLNWPETNMLTFANCKGLPKNGRMVADDGTVLEANDHVYLVCEPPGEPYYLARIMEFLHSKNDTSKPVDAVRINWYYRPKDIGRKAQDTRLVFATMHSDISPLTALRGKCQIRHRFEIENMETYRRTPDSFWFEKLYDRYIQKNYDLIPTPLIVNVPEKVKKVLDERWKYVLVEQGRGKELTSAVKSCKRCSGYCASNDSVDCAVCQQTYHMNCVKPPLLKKPSRGFAWSCAACSRAQERKLEARHTPHAVDHGDFDDEELLEEDEEDVHGIQTDRTTPTEHDAPHQGTAEQIYQASLWPYRYLGMHCKPEDALDYDDRIYPRASTRIGPRNQAPVGPWPGQPVQYVKPMEVKKPGKKEPRLSKEALAAQEAERIRRGNRPKWIQDQPPGYVARGEDLDPDDPNCTSTRLWIPPPSSSDLSTDSINDYVNKAMTMAKKLDLPDHSTNLRDAAVESLFREGYDEQKASQALMKIPKENFKEPSLTPVEQKKFEEAVSKYGSELHLVMKHVKTMPPGQVVRYYYTWKKTDRGQQVWGNYPGRKGKRLARQAEAAASKLADDIADDDDDSAFDTEKAIQKKRKFLCQFCKTTTSRQWRRAPNAIAGLVTENGSKANGKDKNGQYVVSLCRRCAELWRRYAIQWEDIEEVAKKVAQAGGRAWKRKQDEELLKELQAAQEMDFATPERASTPASATPLANGQEPPRKKLKSAPEKEVDAAVSDSGSAAHPAASQAPPQAAAPAKKKEKSLEAAVVPEVPKPRTLPCAICDQLEPFGDQHISCRECRLTVHRNCYGVIDIRNQSKWICDMCANDKNPQVSVHYKCVLCPIEHTEHDLVEQLKFTHHKKKMSEKDRERERMEVQQARKAAEFYRKKQEEMNRPVEPREPLKRTADNNWVHVTCAVWTAEVKFGNAKAMEPAEGIPSIPRSKYDEVCRACNQKDGACISCHQCRVPYHIECARQHGHLLGFDITPVKSSRRDQFNVITLNGESGSMAAMLWCKEHVPTKTIVHRMHDAVNDTGLNALQFYVQNFKQADLTLTGTVRKANLVSTAAKMSGAPVQTANRRASTTGSSHNGTQPPRTGIPLDMVLNSNQSGEKVCITCGIDVTLRWWPIEIPSENQLANGHQGSFGSEAQKFREQRKFQCHKCHKLGRRPPSPEPRYTKASPPGPEPSRAQVAENGLLASATPFHGSPPDYRDDLGRPATIPASTLEPLLAPTPALAPAVHVHGHPPSHPAAHAPAHASTHGAPSHSRSHSNGFTHGLTHAHGHSHGHGHPHGHAHGHSRPHAWPQPLNPHPIGSLAGPPPPAAAHAVQPPPHPQAHGAAHRSVPVSHSYAPAGLPARTTPYNDWSHRPGSRHDSPSHHLNGGPPPPLHTPQNPNPPLTTLASLRPPVMSGSASSASPLSNGHHHGHSSSTYGNGLASPPRRLSGPTPPTSYISPYHGSLGHVGHGPPPHSSSSHGSHGLGSAAQAQAPPTSRGEPFSHGLHPHRPQYPGSHTSPPISRNGLPLPREPLSSSGSIGPRLTDGRPASGASASPSLRNLLS